MIDEKVLRDAGWSEELIQSAKKVSTKIGNRTNNIGSNDVTVIESRPVRESNSITLNAMSAQEFSWPKLQS